MRAYIEAMRSLIYADGRDASTWPCPTPTPTPARPHQERVDLLIPMCKAWSTDLGVEVTSLAIQVYGGMGYVEESGVAQHFRDARITPIYEGTNGIQAMDLVGRKLPMRAGGVVDDFLAEVARPRRPLAKAGATTWPRSASSLAEAIDVLAETTDWLLEHGLADVRDALAGATPYLRMFSLVTGGWIMARQALAAQAALDAGTERSPDAELMAAKVVTARFFAEQLLPAVKGLASPVTAGHQDLFAVEPRPPWPDRERRCRPWWASCPAPATTTGARSTSTGCASPLGVFAAVEIATPALARPGGDPDDIWAIAIWAVPAGLIGARLYHLITDWNDLHPPQPVGRWYKVWDGGLGIPGGIALGVAVGVWVGHRRGIRLPVGLDAVAPAHGRRPRPSAGWGNWFNQELFGGPTSLPWGLQISLAHRPVGYVQFATFQPTFLYESLWNLALAGALVLLDRRRVVRPGRIFALYIGGYAVGRFLVESLRIDHASLILGHPGQPLDCQRLTFVGVVLFLAVKGLRRRPGDDDEPYTDGHRFGDEPQAEAQVEPGGERVDERAEADEPVDEPSAGEQGS